MRSNHDDALFERATLGGSAIAFAVIVSLGSRDNDLDVFLRIAMCLAFFAMPVLLAPWIGKDKVFPSDLGQRRSSPASFGNLHYCLGLRGHIVDHGACSDTCARFRLEDSDCRAHLDAAMGSCGNTWNQEKVTHRA